MLIETYLWLAISELKKLLIGEGECIDDFKKLIFDLQIIIGLLEK